VSYPGTVESVNFRGDRSDCQIKEREKLTTPRKRARKNPRKKTEDLVDGERNVLEGLADSRAGARPDSGEVNTDRNMDAIQPGEPLRILTIGHSTHPFEEFVSLLRNYGVEQLVDVRTVPKSRHVPQFNLESLSVELPKRGIAYVHLKSLGGLRRAEKDSINTGWRNASFRGYADYMASDEFEQGIDRLIELSRTKPTVIMCAEAVPWRCHRSLIGDALLARGVQVEDIMSATSSRPHKLTEFAHVEGHRITYPAGANLELFSP
jgi:hypothetical protein